MCLGRSLLKSFNMINNDSEHPFSNNNGNEIIVLYKANFVILLTLSITHIRNFTPHSCKWPKKAGTDTKDHKWIALNKFMIWYSFSFSFYSIRF